MGDPHLTATLEAPDARTALAAREAPVLEDVVARCAAIKAGVVAADEHERTGLRATLNYGHTLAHALETAGGYGLLHTTHGLAGRNREPVTGKELLALVLQQVHAARDSSGEGVSARARASRA